MFSIIFDLFEMLTGQDHDNLHLMLNVFRLFLVVAVLIGNYAMQLGMLYWIYVYVVLPSVHAVESTYQNYHHEAFTREGTLKQDILESWSDDKMSTLCGIAFNSFLFMFAVLCLWCFAMLNEVRKTYQLFSDIRKVPRSTASEEMIDNQQADGLVRVKSLTPFVRWSLYIVILLPKILICIGLLLIGLVWLTATDDFSDLILNAVSLEFVINIDNILFSACLPDSLIERIRVTKFCKFKRTVPRTLAQQESETMRDLVSSAGYFFGSILFVYSFMTIGQTVPLLGVFPGYDHDIHCPAYFEKITRQFCQAGQECFPFGDV